MLKALTRGKKKLLILIWVALLSSPVFAQNNILLIIADDFGVDSHDLYGIGSITPPTPVINSIAARGVRFNRVWSNPVCSPTRATILTGRYSFRTGVGAPYANHQIPPTEYTVADALGALGYGTAMIGKWHLGAYTTFRPDAMGFDHYSGYWDGRLPDYFNWTKVRNGVYIPTTTYATTENVNDAIEWISGQEQSSPDQPWFVWLAFHAPHDPFHKPPNSLHSYDSLPGTAADIAANPVPYYHAMVEAMDTEIGRLLGTIDLSETAVIFIGDNGTPGEVVVAPAIRGRVKGSLYEGGLWVPLLISDPSYTHADAENDALVNSVDLFATMIEMAGGTVSDLVPPGVPVDSNSLLPLLNNPLIDHSCEYLVAEQFHEPITWGDGKAIRNESYKLIQFDPGIERLYYLSNLPAMYPLDESEDLLERVLTPIEQANYDELSSKLASLTSGDDTDRSCNTGTPNANAGDDLSVTEGESVLLDGSSSADSDGTIVAYFWEQTGGPDVELVGYDTASATFNAPEVEASTTLTFTLTVTDDQDNTGLDAVTVTVWDVDAINILPIAEAGADRTVDERLPVTLNGNGSTDPDGEIVSYAWLQTGGPDVELLGGDMAIATFNAPEVNESTPLTFTLTVTDNRGDTNSDSVTVAVEPVPIPIGNLALNMSTQSSSTYKSSLGPDKAVDGSTTSRWSSKFSDPQWISVDLVAEYSINNVVLDWEAAYGQAYQVQVSLDGNSWSTVYTETNGNGGVDDVAFSSINARYVRIYGTKRGTNWGYSIWELEVYGSAVAADPLELTTLIVSPTSSSVTVGDSVQYTATALDQYGDPFTTTVSWGVSGGGSIDPAGLFAATSPGGPFTVTGSAGGLNATAQLTVTEVVTDPPELTTLTVSPPSSTVTVGDSVQYTATALDQYGDPFTTTRSEERRVGKECRSRWSPYH